MKTRVRWMNYVAAVFAAGLPGVLVTGSCGLVLDDFEKYDPALETIDDAGADAEPLCQKLSYPGYPMDVPDSGDIDFVVAVRTVELGESAPADNPVGINLDQTCTCISEGPSCIYPTWANKDHCDDKNGVDNAAAKVFKSIVAALGETGFGSSFYSKMAEEGEWSLLLRVQGYNGQLNDPKVKFSIYTTPGYGNTVGAGGAGGMPVEPDPKWDGTDEWDVSTDSLQDMATLDLPIYFDDKAYVSEGTLVANLTESVIRFAGTNSKLSIKLTAGSFLGSIQNPASDSLGFRIVNGTVSGRWKTEDLFDNLGTFTAEGQSFCNDGGFIYNTFKKTVCGYVDIASTLGGPTLECDSLSFAMRVQTHPAKLGPIYVPDDAMSSCPVGQNPADDGCGM